jgi:hypothetical protein
MFQLSNSSSDGRENEGGSVRPLSYAESIGVTRVQATTFKVGGQSYTSLADAVAQARRLQQSGAAL